MKLIGRRHTYHRGVSRDRTLWYTEACTDLVLDNGGVQAAFKDSFFEYVRPLDECELRNAIVKQSRQELDFK